MTTTVSIDELEARLGALRAEHSSLPRRIQQAKRAGDGQEWLSALAREEALPEEIEAVRRELLPLRLERAWRTVEPLYGVERQRQTEVDAIEERKRGRDRDGYPQYLIDAMATRDRVQIAAATNRHQGELLELHGEYERARLALGEAEDAVGTVLFEIDEIEAELEQLTGEHPADGADGLRARPLVLTHTVVLAYETFARTPAGAELAGGSRHLFAGTRPPRWAAHRLRNPKLYEPIVEPEIVYAAGETWSGWPDSVVFEDSSTGEKIGNPIRAIGGAKHVR